MLKNLIFLILFLFASIICFAQNDYYGENNELKYDNRIYKKDIATVQLHIQGDPLGAPILELNDDKQLVLSFDDLSRELKDYYYTFIHCNTNWQPSDLMQNEYIEGMPEDLLFENDYSRNTIQKYINHRIVFPNDNINLTKSGNYIVYIFEDGDRENPVISYRFMITEPLASINAHVRPGGGGSQRLYNQSVSFTLSSANYELSNPYDNLKVFVQQNLRWDNMIGPVEPAFVKGQEIEYGIANETNFDGGNEFRFFNTTDLNFISEGIEKNTRDENGVNHVFLEQTKKRTYLVYLERRDINGKYYIKNTQWGDNPDVDADYAQIHFSLKAEHPFGHNVYVMGQLSNWMMTSNNLMKYNTETKQYEATLFLKQGLYNYIYVMENNDGTGISLEGAHYDTENDYYIFAYHRGLSDRYDKLIAIKQINSKRDL